MTMVTDPIGRVRRLLTVDRPVTYWSFWRTLLRGSPVLLVAVAIAALVGSGRFTVVSVAPVPYVFAAATLGYAVRDLDSGGILTSFGFAAVYTAILWLTDVGPLLLARPRLLLAVLGILTFVAGIAGFISPTLHGGRDTSLAAAQEEFERRQRYED